MWLVEDHDTHIYILGTMHALPRGTDWDDGKVADAIQTANELILELSPAELAAAGAVFSGRSRRATPRSRSKRESRAKRWPAIARSKRAGAISGPRRSTIGR
jgi:uncharacterized protein YbaP (TraB family)